MCVCVCVCVCVSVCIGRDLVISVFIAFWFFNLFDVSFSLFIYLFFFFCRISFFQIHYIITGIYIQWYTLIYEYTWNNPDIVCESRNISSMKYYNPKESWLVAWVLWNINFCRLFNAKSIFIQIISSISNNSQSMNTQFNWQKHIYFKLFSLVKQF